MIVDNESTSGQASSIYFGTLATSTTSLRNHSRVLRG